MTNADGPWKRNAPPPRRDGLRVAIWIALMLAGALALWELAKLFPGSVNSDWDRTNLFRYVAILVVVSGGLMQARRFPVREIVRNIALWMGIVAILVLGYSFQDELSSVGLRVRSALIPGYPVSTGANEMVLSESDGGNYFVFGSANGTPVRFLIDTGASDIVLSPADAKLAGIAPDRLDYSRNYETANGVGHGSAAVVTSLNVGPISLSNVPVAVNQAPMDSSVLGMAFLRRLKSFAVRDGRLYLRWQ